MDFQGIQSYDRPCRKAHSQHFTGRAPGKEIAMKKNPEITNSLFELFKSIVKLNQYRFKDMHEQAV